MVAGVENRDKTIFAERSAFRAVAHPLVPAVLTEDGYFKDILQTFDPKQQEVILGAVEELAAVKFTGRTSNELVIMKGPEGDQVFVDPLLRKYGSRFRRFRIEDPKETVQMADTAAGLVLEAYRNDPSIDRLPIPAIRRGA